MSNNQRVYPEYFPTDIRFVDSYLNVVLSSGHLTATVLHLGDKLKNYNTSLIESILICNWIVRRILSELPLVQVLDFEMNSELEELYEDHFEEVEKHVFLNAAKRILEAKDFKPTMVQAMVTGDKILLSFGATNVHTFNSKKTK